VWNGTEIKDFSYNWGTNYLKYLDTGVLQYPATLPIGLKDTQWREYIWNSVIFGHSSYWKNNNWNYKTIFGLLPTLDIWEQVWVYKKNSVGSYTLYKHKITSSYETNPNDISILLQENYDTQGLTLFTCTPIGWIDGRWVIRSERTNESLSNIKENIQEKIAEEIDESTLPNDEVSEEVQVIEEEILLEIEQEFETVQIADNVLSQKLWEIEKEQLKEPFLNLEKGKDYVLENDFDFCSTIQSLHDSNLEYKTEWIYTDITWITAEQEILKFTKLDIVDGYIDGTFAPNAEITRAEFLKVALISHCYEYQNEDASFLEYVDVDKNSWQAKVISKAQSLWMVNGDTVKNEINIGWYIWDWSSVDDIKKLQNILSQSGLYNWIVDGEYSPELYETIYEFQRENQLVNSKDNQWAGFWGIKTQQVFQSQYNVWEEISVFRPNDIISKAEAVKILMQLSQIQAMNKQTTWYKDINISWHKWYVENGEALGLFSSEIDNWVFNPNSWVQRKDMVSLIYELIQLYK